jgi:hypothetical protein
MDRDSDRARAARDDNDGGIGDRREREVNMPSPMESRRRAASAHLAPGVSHRSVDRSAYQDPYLMIG